MGRTLLLSLLRLLQFLGCEDLLLLAETVVLALPARGRARGIAGGR